MSQEPGRLLEREECVALLGEVGIPYIETFTSHTPEAAARAVRDREGPWVLKAGGLVHKSDAAGVCTGLADEEAVGRAARAMLERLGSQAGPLMLQRQQNGVEMLVGLRRDPGLGAVAVVGMGGIHTEILCDTEVGLVPLTAADAGGLLSRLRGWPLLAGNRGSDPVDIDALSAVVAAVSDLAERNPHLVEVDLNPVIVGQPGEGAVAVDVRMRVRYGHHEVSQDESPRPPSTDIGRAMNPDHVVVVGVSDDARKVGARIYDHLLRHGFPGRLDAVHPSGGNIRGRPRLRTLDDLDASPDLVCVAVPASRVHEVAEAAVRCQAGALLVHSAGFAEVGPDGQRSQEDLVSITRAGRVPLLGPNSMGIVAPGRGLAASLAGSLGLDSLRPGGISLLSASGALSSCLASRLWERAGGIANWITLGNEADVDLPAYLEWVAEDEETTTVGLLIEHLTDGPRFIAAARAVRRAGKPLFAYNTGRTDRGRAAAVSHTGAMVGSHAIREQVLAAGGVASVGTLAELEDVLLQSERLALPAGPRLGVITGSGGACAIIADACEEHGLQLPPFPAGAVRRLRGALPAFAAVDNPLDVTAHVLNHPGSFGPVVDAGLAAGAFDALLVQFTTNADPNAEVTAEQVIRARDAASIPVYVARYGAHSVAPRGVARYAEAGVPLLDTPEQAVAAVAGLWRASARVVEY